MAHQCFGRSVTGKYRYQCSAFFSLTTKAPYSAPESATLTSCFGRSPGPVGPLSICFTICNRHILDPSAHRCVRTCEQEQSVKRIK